MRLINRQSTIAQLITQLKRGRAEMSIAKLFNLQGSAALIKINYLQARVIKSAQSRVWVTTRNKRVKVTNKVMILSVWISLHPRHSQEIRIIMMKKKVN
jgi:hypothetical protein